MACEGQFIGKLPLIDEKRLGGFGLTTKLGFAPPFYAKKAVFYALFLVNACKSDYYKLEKYARNYAPRPEILRRGHS